MLDCIIVGSGISGLEAALNLKIRNLSIMVIGPEISSKIQKAPEINNYLGLPKITGSQFTGKIKEHLDILDISIKEDIIREIYPMGKSFILLSNKEQYEAKTVILATGLTNVSLIKGEEEFLGKGVSYCASCDGPLFKNKKILVYGKTDELDYLKSLSSDVTLINKIDEIKYKKIIVQGKEIPYDGLFIFRDVYQISTMVRGLKTENNSILTNRLMETNIKGLFACGDITGKPYQYIKAAGEGSTAAYSVIKYLTNRD